MASSGTIDFSQGYVSGHECKWKVQCEPNQVATIVCESFETERLEDYIVIYDGMCPGGLCSAISSGETVVPGEYIDSMHHERLSGRLELSLAVGLPVLSSTLPGITMTFDANDEYDGKGFLAIISCGLPGDDPPPQENPCAGGTHLQDTGTIDFAGGYDNHFDCRWILTCSDNARRVRASFGSFSTVDSEDFVYAYNGADYQHAAEIGERRSGARRPPPIMTTEHQLTIRYTDMGDPNHDNGFAIQFTCLSADVAENYVFESDIG